ncbi:MAG TPA: alanine racemase [Woeseiaceae bacterium]|nr:alanine racemase [Woeseiaceae bacterium]
MTAPCAHIRVDALQHNYQRLCLAAGGAKVIAVIKGNAYGHGLLTVARALPDADAFAVARLADALALSEAGIGQPIVLLGGVYDASELATAVGKRFELVVHCRPQLELLEAAAPARAVVWLEVDTGMHRLGIDPEECAAALQRLSKCKAVGELRLMTHLACADDRRDARTDQQVARFRSLLASFDGPISVANSPGVLGWPNSICAGVDPGRSFARCGIALYGISPFAGTIGAEFGLRPVMHFEAGLIAVTHVRAGECVGYGATWTARRDTVIGIIAAGYGDGYSRFLPSGTPVLVNGRRAELAGRVSMDLTAIDLGPDGAEQIGDPVTLWGDGLPVEEVAASAGTIPYTLVTGVRHTLLEPAIAGDG